MERPGICAVIVDNDLESVQEVGPLVDLFEVRIDLIGDGWPELVKHLEKPWIACNRTVEEGGKWNGNESERIWQLFQAMELGADMVDIEVKAKNLNKIVPLIKRKATCLLSYHDLEKTPTVKQMTGMVRKQLKAGADICKVVTTARQVEDNISVLQLLAGFPGVRLVSFAMGPLGVLSRVLCPLAGGDFIYASIGKGRESARGQLTVKELRDIYSAVSVTKALHFSE